MHLGIYLIHFSHWDELLKNWISYYQFHAVAFFPRNGAQIWCISFSFLPNVKTLMKYMELCMNAVSFVWQICRKFRTIKLQRNGNIETQTTAPKIIYLLLLCRIFDHMGTVLKTFFAILGHFWTIFFKEYFLTGYTTELFSLLSIDYDDEPVDSIQKQDFRDNSSDKKQKSPRGHQLRKSRNNIRRKSEAYQHYIVEQWTLSRSKETEKFTLNLHVYVLFVLSNKYLQCTSELLKHI